VGTRRTTGRLPGSRRLSGGLLGFSFSSGFLFLSPILHVPLRCCPRERRSSRRVFLFLFPYLFLYPPCLNSWMFLPAGLYIVSRERCRFLPPFIAITYISFLSIPSRIPSHYPIPSLFVVHCSSSLFPRPIPSLFSSPFTFFLFPRRVPCHHISSRSLAIPYIPHAPPTHPPPPRCPTLALWYSRPNPQLRDFISISAHSARGLRSTVPVPLWLLASRTAHPLFCSLRVDHSGPSGSWDSGTLGPFIRTANISLQLCLVSLSRLSPTPIKKRVLFPLLKHHPPSTTHIHPPILARASCIPFQLVSLSHLTFSVFLPKLFLESSPSLSF